MSGDNHNQADAAHALVMRAGSMWTCACGRAGMDPRPGGRGLTHPAHVADVTTRGEVSS